MLDQAIVYLVQALGGVVGGNILGALTQGGGGALGRTIIGAIGGVVAGYCAGAFAPVGDIAAYWSGLGPPNVSEHLSNLITGAVGGAILGLVGGLIIRPRG